MCETLSLYAGILTIGDVFLGLHKPTRELSCPIFLGPEDHTGLEVLISETQSVSDKLVKLAVQFPKDMKDESVPCVCTIGIKKTALLFDPQVLNWLKYFPVDNEIDPSSDWSFNKKISDARNATSSVQRRRSESETDITKKESSTATPSETKTGSKIQSMSRQNTLTEPAVKTWKEHFVGLYPFFSKLLIHIDVDTATLFLPSSPINIVTDRGLVNAVHRIYLTRGERTSLGDTSVVCFPHCVLHNAAQKQSLLQYIHDIPVILPLDLWSSGNRNILILLMLYDTQNICF